MASPETRQINAINATWAGASGAATDIDEVIGSPDTAYYGAGADADAADFGFGASEVVDGDTVTNISFNLIYRDDGTAGTLLVDVDLLIGGSVVGTAVQLTVSGSDATYSDINDTGWNVDRTAAEMDGAELRLTPTQSGMPGTNAGYLETANMVVTFTGAASATHDQAAFRGRNDDGTLITATNIAAENTDFSFATATTFRIRFQINETSGGATSITTLKLKYSYNSGGWTNVTGSSSVIQATSGTVSDGTAVTNDYLATSGGTFRNGGFDASDATINMFNDSDGAGNDHSECEFCLTIVDADVSPVDTIDLRLEYNAGGAFDAYSQIPRVTVAGDDTFFENRHQIEQGLKANTAAGLGGVLIE